jgi:putative ABC transport system permease protein
MRLPALAHLYRVRLKTRAALVQELLAVLGLAAGVALLFASQISSASLNGSVGALTRELVGHMQLQLDARGPAGFQQDMLGEVKRLPGVREASPVLEVPANAVGPTAQRGVELIGIDPRFALQGSRVLQRFDYAQVAHLWALAVPSPIATATGVQTLEPIKLQLAGREETALVGAELSAGAVGALASSPVVVAPLAYAQHLAGMPGRITRVYVQVLPGREREVREGLQRLAGNVLNVEPADFDATLFAVAAAPINQGAGLFAAISALVGFLFAFNAMLLTVPLRQGLVRSLRANGATRAGIVAALLFDALVLGAMAAALGLALGDGLSLLVFRTSPGYLSFAFPVGSQRIVSWHSVAVASGAGLLAACVGVLAPAWGASERLSQPASPVHRSSHVWVLASLALGLACLLLTTAILLLAPQSAVLGSAVLVIALLVMLPRLLDGIVGLFDRAQERFGSAATRVAVAELRSPSTRARSLAIAATGAIAVFGSVAIQGAQANLQHGIDRVAHDLARGGDLWIVAPGTQNLLGTSPFHGPSPSVLARLPGVRAAGAYRAGFLNFGRRRVWVLAPSPTARQRFPHSQLLGGHLARTTARLRTGGWAVLSEALAAQEHLRAGEAFTLPSPRPVVLRVAALSTNLSWPPGAVVLNPRDYVRAFGSALPDAYNVMLAPGANLPAVRSELRRALGGRSGLLIETGRHREERLRATSRQGSSRLTQIATLLLIATVISMSVAMAAMISQRRPRLARMKVQGYSRRVLWRALLVESALLLGAGCSVGAAFGVFGQLLISHALASVTGFPVLFSVGALIPLAVSLLVSAVAVTIVALPGYRAAGVPAYS